MREGRLAAKRQRRGEIDRSGGFPDSTLLIGNSDDHAPRLGRDRLPVTSQKLKPENLGEKAGAIF